MRTSTLRRLGAVAAAVAVTASVIAAPAVTAAPAGPANGPKPVEVKLLALNDFHGNLEPPSGSGGRIQTGVGPDGNPVTVDAGGMEYLATQLAQL